ncbi:MAG TPA: mycothiol synthase [Actinobacteria bacterium]|nr:mycothiol synthase [Actinomycetota bacterium]
MNAAVALTAVEHLAPANINQVRQLVERVSDADGDRPLSEHAWLHLRHGGDHGVVHVLAQDDSGHLIGYAHLDTTDPVEGSSVELCVDPQARGQGIGTALVTHAQDRSPDGRLRLWAHGQKSGAMALATSLGYTRSRTLLQMRRSLFTPLPAPTLPHGVRLRTFQPGVDDAHWLAVNAAAFAEHPEQGSWTQRSLELRMAESWFDPEGFFLAVRDEANNANGVTERIVGFHWTKVHGGHTHHHAADGSDHAHQPIGEVYVVGVAPDSVGQGFGKALVLVGLRHLRSAGLSDAMLYVEADNHAARALYESLGFTWWDTDVMFRVEA